MIPIWQTALESMEQKLCLKFLVNIKAIDVLSALDTSVEMVNCVTIEQ